MHGNYWTDAIGREIANGSVATIQELLRHLTNPDKEEKKKKRKKNVKPLAALGENIKGIPLKMNVFVQQFRGQFIERARAISFLTGLMDRVPPPPAATRRRGSDCTRLTLPDQPLSRRGGKVKYLHGDAPWLGGGGGGGASYILLSLCLPRAGRVCCAIKRQRSRVITPPPPPCHGAAGTE